MYTSDEQPGNESFPPEFESSAGLPTQRLSLSPEVFAGRAGTGRPAADNTTWRVAFKIFKSKWRSWEDLFKEAAAFATSVGPERYQLKKPGAGLGRRPGCAQGEVFRLFRKDLV